MMLLAGCATVPTDSYCELAKPIWWQNRAELDATPDEIVRQVVTHNEMVKRVCGS